MNQFKETIKLDGKRHYVTTGASLVNIHNKQARSNLLLDLEDAKELLQQLQFCIDKAEGHNHAA